MAHLFIRCSRSINWYLKICIKNTKPFYLFEFGLKNAFWVSFTLILIYNIKAHWYSILISAITSFKCTSQWWKKLLNAIVWLVNLPIAACFWHTEFVMLFTFLSIKTKEDTINVIFAGYMALFNILNTKTINFWIW